MESQILSYQPLAQTPNTHNKTQNNNGNKTLQKTEGVVIRIEKGKG